jgi:hypothetical protein
MLPCEAYGWVICSTRFSARWAFPGDAVPSSGDSAVPEGLRVEYLQRVVACAPEILFGPGLLAPVLLCNETEEHGQGKSKVKAKADGYASRLYRIPDGFEPGSDKGTYVQVAPPEHTRGDVILPIEGDR